MNVSGNFPMEVQVVAKSELNEIKFYTMKKHSAANNRERDCKKHALGNCIFTECVIKRRWQRLVNIHLVKLMGNKW